MPYYFHYFYFFDCLNPSLNLVLFLYELVLHFVHFACPFFVLQALILLRGSPLFPLLIPDFGCAILIVIFVFHPRNFAQLFVLLQALAPVSPFLNTPALILKISPHFQLRTFF